MNTKELGTEWRLLQNQFDSYEKHSLYIKLSSIIVLLIAAVTGQTNSYIILILSVLWLQDGIWKTFQSRIEIRLLQIEKCIAEKSEENAFQFNTAYDEASLNGLSLVGEYTRQSIRPTVAFPHSVLILIALIQSIS